MNADQAIFVFEHMYRYRFICKFQRCNCNKMFSIANCKKRLDRDLILLAVAATDRFVIILESEHWEMKCWFYKC